MFPLTVMNNVDQCDKTQYSDASVMALERHASAIQLVFWQFDDQFIGLLHNSSTTSTKLVRRRSLRVATADVVYTYSTPGGPCNT